MLDGAFNFAKPLTLVFSLFKFVYDGFCHKIITTVQKIILSCFWRYRFSYCCNFLDNPPDLYYLDLLIAQKFKKITNSRMGSRLSNYSMILGVISVTSQRDTDPPSFKKVND